MHSISNYSVRVGVVGCTKLLSWTEEGCSLYEFEWIIWTLITPGTFSRLPGAISWKYRDLYIQFLSWSTHCSGLGWSDQQKLYPRRTRPRRPIWLWYICEVSWTREVQQIALDCLWYHSTKGWRNVVLRSGPLQPLALSWQYTASTATVFQIWPDWNGRFILW
jgi:hypothetical protein